jgi:hypothetical protein
MKNIYLLFFLSLSLSLYSQTATNFNCNDCNNQTHDLFTELDAGKVIIIDWVMPCSSCAPASVKAHNIVQNYAISNPGRVFLYIVDDYANTTCPNLQAWADAYGISNATLFSNSSIKMSDYGAAGMPKVVVLGCYNHLVFYNEKNTAIDSTDIVNAVNTALACATGIENNSSVIQQTKVYPNPARNVATFSFTLNKSANVSVYLANTLGQKVADIFTGEKSEGDVQIEINTSHLHEGMYLIRYSVNDEIFTKPFFKSN